MTTSLAALIAALRGAGVSGPGVEAPPDAMLWCDPNQELAPLLRRALPNLLPLGEHDPAKRQGPAIWLRAARRGWVSPRPRPRRAEAAPSGARRPVSR